MATRKSTVKRTTRPTRVTKPQPEPQRQGLMDFFRFGESYTSLVLGIVVVIITAILLVSFVKNRNIGQINETQPQIVATNDESEMATRSAEVDTTVSPAQAITGNKIAQAITHTPTPTNRPTSTTAPTKQPTATATPTRAATPTRTVATATPTKAMTPTRAATATPTKVATPTPTKVVAQQPTITLDPKTAKGTYTVVAGDNLWKIAEKTYRSGYNWVDIARVNNLSNANVLGVGTKLTLPNVQPKQLTVQPEIQEAQKITGTSYKVVKGDNLWTIAVRAYGDGYRWTEIAQNNNIVNPNIIYSGTVLKIKR